MSHNLQRLTTTLHKLDVFIAIRPRQRSMQLSKRNQFTLCWQRMRTSTTLAFLYLQHRLHGTLRVRYDRVSDYTAQEYVAAWPGYVPTLNHLTETNWTHDTTPTDGGDAVPVMEEEDDKNKTGRGHSAYNRTAEPYIYGMYNGRDLRTLHLPTT
ncbi:hypothetical protein CBL_05530 [Carabus blaptoides fortunei]